MQRIAIFAHFDKHNIIDDYVVKYLTDLQSSVGEVVFVSSAKLPNSELKKIQHLTLHCIVKDNTGYDFASYRDGYNWIKENKNIENYDELVICNDSCFGAFHPFNNMFNKMANKDCDFWGLADCFVYSHHVQSYFLVFRKNIIKSNTLGDFLNNVQHQQNKQNVIQKYEVGLSSFLIDKGFKQDIFLSVTDFFNRFLKSDGNIIFKKFVIAKRFRESNISSGANYFFYTKSTKLNRTVFFSFVDYFLKTESPLLKKNTFVDYYLLSQGLIKANFFKKRKAAMVYKKYIKHIKNNSNYDIKLIENYVKRMAEQ